MKKIASFLAIFFILSLVVSAFVIPDKPLGHVNDYANVLPLDTKNQLEETLRIVTASTSNEIAVVTVPDLGGDTIEHYAVTLFEKWKIGNAKNDNGVLLLVSIADRKVRIEVGYGLEGALPDITAKNIIDTQITPSFKEGNYSLGIVQGVRAITEATKGEYVGTGSVKSSSFNIGTIEILLVVAFFVFQFIISIFARSKSWWAGGILGGVVGGAITFFSIFGITLVVGGVITVILIFLGLIFDYIVSNAYASSATSGGGIPWWAGGGKGSSSGGSFGGYSGGSSGGGGASGSW